MASKQPVQGLARKRKMSAYNAATSEIAAAFKRGELPDVGDDIDKQRAHQNYLIAQQKSKKRWAGREYAICTVTSPLNAKGHEEFQKRLKYYSARYCYVTQPALSFETHADGMRILGKITFLRGKCSAARIAADLAKVLGVPQGSVNIVLTTEDAARNFMAEGTDDFLDFLTQFSKMH